MGLCGFTEAADAVARKAGKLPAVFNAGDICVRRGTYGEPMYMVEVGQSKPVAEEGNTMDMSSLTNKDLRAICEERGFPVNGRETKADLIAQLTNEDTDYEQ